MSTSHVHIPSLEDLKTILSENPSKLEYYKKVGGWIGSTESIDYLNSKIEKS